jgi:hypothetical protein
MTQAQPRPKSGIVRGGIGHELIVTADHDYGLPTLAL